MPSTKDIFESHILLSKRLEAAAALHDFDIKFLEDGGVVAMGGYYKLLMHHESRQVMLVAAHDPDDLAGTACEGQWSYPTFPEKLRIVKIYDSMPMLRQAIRSDIISDRPQWFDFMLHYGNLLQLPIRDHEALHFKNDFATYDALAVKPGKSGKPAYDVYAYFDAYGHTNKKRAKNSQFIEHWSSELQSIKFKGIYIGHVEGDKKIVTKYVHQDFCKKFLRFLEGKHPLAPEDIGQSPFRALTMFVNNKLSAFELKNLIDFDWWIDAIKTVIEFDPRDFIFTAAHVIYGIFRRSRDLNGKYFEALLPSAHSGYAQHHLIAAEAKNWRILTATEARLYPLGTPVYKNLAQGWILEDMLSAIHGSTPCLVQNIGNDVLSVQEPNGTKLYYGSKSEVYIVFAPDQKLEPVANSDPDLFRISGNLSCFYETGKVVCLRVKPKQSVMKNAPGIANMNNTSYEIERTVYREQDAYKQIAHMAGCAAEVLRHEDKPGTPEFYRTALSLKIARAA